MISFITIIDCFPFDLCFPQQPLCWVMFAFISCTINFIFILLSALVWSPVAPEGYLGSSGCSTVFWTEHNTKTNYSTADLLIPADTCWFLLIPADSCWFLLIPADTCWFLLIPGDTCWYLLIPGVTWWYLVFCLLVKLYWTRLLSVPEVQFLCGSVHVCVCQMLPSTLFSCRHYISLLLLFGLGLFGLSWLSAGRLMLLLIGSFLADRCCRLAASQTGPVSVTSALHSALLTLCCVGPTAVTGCRPAIL